MSSQYIYLILFAAIVYLIATDNSIASAIVLYSKIIRVWYEKEKWWIFHNPANPLIKYMMWRRSLKLAKELEKELNDRSK